MLFKPVVGEIFRENGENMNLRLGDVVINAKVVHSQSIFRLAKSPQALNVRIALLARFVSQVSGYNVARL